MRPFLLAFLLCFAFPVFARPPNLPCALLPPPRKTASSGASSQGKNSSRHQPPGRFRARPPALQQWKDWVLYDHKDRKLPQTFQQRQAAPLRFPQQKSHCGSGIKQAEFTQQWQVFRRKRRTAALCKPVSWPVEVTANGVAAPVADKKRPPRGLSAARQLYAFPAKLLWSAPPEKPAFARGHGP